MNKYTGFSVVAQYHEQPPFETKAYRPRRAREFMPEATLTDVWDWVRETQGLNVESVEIRPLDYSVDGIGA